MQRFDSAAAVRLLAVCRTIVTTGFPDCFALGAAMTDVWTEAETLPSGPLTPMAAAFALTGEWLASRASAQHAIAATHVLAEMVTLWASDISEPVAGRVQHAITDFIMGELGLGWNTCEVGPDARPGMPYTENGMFEYCGAFAARALHRLVGPKARSRDLASTYRIERAFKPARDHVIPAAVRPGDLIMVGGQRGGRPKHIALTLACAGAHVYTIEGNAYGQGPDGHKREGVVFRVRPVGLMRSHVPLSTLKGVA